MNQRQIETLIEILKEHVNQTQFKFLVSEVLGLEAYENLADDHPNAEKISFVNKLKQQRKADTVPAVLVKIAERHNDDALRDAVEAAFPDLI